MELENINGLLLILTRTLENKNCEADKQNIQYLYDEVKNIKNNLPTLDKLEVLQKLERDLETKYEDFYELNIYFDPLYVEIKKKIHDKNIEKIREENRRKRVEK